MPVNATTDSYGTGWECDRGFRESDGVCVATLIPANAMVTKTSYGRGTETACLAVELPPDAHLDYSGNDLECDRPSERQQGRCVLP